MADLRAAVALVAACAAFALLSAFVSVALTGVAGWTAPPTRPHPGEDHVQVDSDDDDRIPQPGAAWLAPLAARALESAEPPARPPRGPARDRGGPPGPMLPPVLEFYADAGAPRGALYLNGELVGTLPGVTRL